MKKIILGLSILFLSGCANQASVSPDAIFEWDFSSPKKYVYSYSQTIFNENRTTKESPIDKIDIYGEGFLNVRVKDDSFADLSLTDIEVKMIDYEEGVLGDTMTQTVPTNVVQDMKSDGSFGNSNTDILYKVLFPLPNKDLEKGESHEIAMQMPFNANGSLLYVKGQNKLTFTGYEELEGVNCAVIEGDIDISNLELPEELNGEYKFSNTGKATYYFDLENGYFIGSDIQLLMDAMMDSEADNEEGMGMYLEMKSDNIFKIRLLSIEE